MISIGDHEQLRPQINNFKDLSLESRAGILYQLDRSQFERLSVGQHGRSRLPVAQLNVQRRMRPQISNLINSIYPELVDHNSTKIYPGVVGMRQNVSYTEILTCVAVVFFLVLLKPFKILSSSIGLANILLGFLARSCQLSRWWERSRA